MEWTEWLGRLAGGGRPMDRFGIAKLHATARGGWEWHDRWGEGPRRSLAWGPDRLDSRFLVQGTGDCLIHGATGPRAGQLRTGGLSPVLVVSGFAMRAAGAGRPAAKGPKEPRWRNLEVTLYAQAGHEALSVTYAGIESVCWPGGAEGDWTGWKFVTRNADGGRSLAVEVWTDRTGARDGGDWRLARSVRLSAECASLETDYSVYIRCDGTEERHFRHLSVREIEPLPGPFPGRTPAAAALYGRNRVARGWHDVPNQQLSPGQGLLPLQTAPRPAGDDASPAPPRPLSEAARATRGRLGSLLDGSRAYRPGDWTMGSLAALLLLAAQPARAQDAAAPARRCDLALQSTPAPGTTRLSGPAGQGGCLDLLAMEGGGGVETAGNTTRIERDGIVLCKSAFRRVTPAEADIVFIYDNSGSMWPTHAFVDPIRRDTSFFFSAAPGYSGCFSSDTAGTLTYATRAGARTLPLLKSAAGCRDHAGDPYSARGAVIAAAIDYMARTSPSSSAGTVAFSTRTAWEQPPVLLFDPSRAALVKSAIRMEVAGGTAYGPPLFLAKKWLRDPTVARTARQAIVFISDGAPSDTAGPGAYLSLVDGDMPPIFSIFLGRPEVSDTAKLLDLSRRTGGSFHRVDPGDVAGIDAVMQGIVRSLLVTTLPKSIVVSNQGLSPPQASFSVGLRRNPDSSVTVFLDSVLALRRGENEIRFRIVLSDTAVREHALRVRADGPEAPASQGSLRCFDQPALSLLNPTGYADTAYPMLERTYQGKLTRFGADLDRLTLAAGSEPAGAVPGTGAAGDAEAFVLRLDQAAHGHPVYRDPICVKGGVESAHPGNGILEGPRKGALILSWVHPRDARERAALRLGSAGASGAQGFIAARRVRDVATGGVPAGPVDFPVVIRGGAELRPGGASGPALAWKGCLWNCGGREESLGDPAKAPGFVFKTRAPFAFDLKLYDHLGRFVNSASGRVDAAKWAKMPRVDDSVAVVMSILPVSREGNILATGAYVVRAVIRTDAAELPDGKGGILVVAPGVLTLLDKFGYTRL